MASGSVNMVEILLKTVGVSQPYTDTVKESGTRLQFGTVSTIAEVFAGGGSSSSSRKRYLRSVNSVTHLPPRSQLSITFSDTDFSMNDPKQDDPVVVTATIANWRVHKILIDQGSSTDVLYWSMFLKLNVPETTV